ncbi:hypothetical protein QO003_001161 [Arthrobacter silviterrae]|uniref:Type IV toxin-antitoxin system AbiEi family antitoxin domain-containing protein n=1 Tax=Arthrobacter silviterrae TaxID=2026658 RepID=A0ABX0D7Z2_9MICC|nr:hypothetical protein [Arthrobacter silviterrae]MDQ0276858.1 hypothetical protein [Arthrobacter silviterrae]NGN83006.1 hypothetical protein [Arthrobacter silviterrae]
MTTLELPPFISAPSKFVSEHGSRQLSRRAASGELVRVRQGLYLPTEVWAALKPWEQHRVRVQAVQELAVNPPVFARESAAEVMGLPVFGVPLLVQTVIPPGTPGGQSRNGVRRIMAVEGDPEPWAMFGLRVTRPVETARDLAVHLPLERALPAMDKLLQGKILPGSPHGTNLTFGEEHMRESLARLGSMAKQNRVRRVLDVADAGAQSAGESRSRAIMILNGFPRPVLQKPFFDDWGLVGYPDFDWEEFKVIGEFDGFEKYSAQRYLKGKTPSQVVVEEKKREDRLRALGYTVVRWVWDDLRDPRLLVAKLHKAGLPSGSGSRKRV